MPFEFCLQQHSAEEVKRATNSRGQWTSFALGTQSQIEVSKLALKRGEIGEAVPTFSRGTTIITSDCVHISFSWNSRARTQIVWLWVRCEVLGKYFRLDSSDWTERVPC